MFVNNAFSFGFDVKYILNLFCCLLIIFAGLKYPLDEFIKMDGGLLLFISLLSFSSFGGLII